LNKLLIQKLAVAFVVSFAGALVASLTGLASQPNFGWDKATVIAVVVGALGVAMRAVLAYGPLNLVPSDAQHTIGGKQV
jgi:hypothetical protein